MSKISETTRDRIKLVQQEQSNSTKYNTMIEVFFQAINLNSDETYTIDEIDDLLTKLVESIEGENVPKGSFTTTADATAALDPVNNQPTSNSWTVNITGTNPGIYKWFQVDGEPDGQWINTAAFPTLVSDTSDGLMPSSLYSKLKDYPAWVDLNGRIALVEANLTTIEGEISDLNAFVNQLNTFVTNNTNEINALKNRVSALEANDGDKETRIVAIENKEVQESTGTRSLKKFTGKLSSKAYIDKLDAENVKTDNSKPVASQGAIDGSNGDKLPTRKDVKDLTDPIKTAAEDAQKRVGELENIQVEGSNGTQETLKDKSKLITEARAKELDAVIEGKKQDKQDNALETTSKEVVGAINEVNKNADDNTARVEALEAAQNITTSGLSAMALHNDVDQPFATDGYISFPNSDPEDLIDLTKQDNTGTDYQYLIDSQSTSEHGIKIINSKNPGARILVNSTGTVTKVGGGGSVRNVTVSLVRISNGSETITNASDKFVLNDDQAFHSFGFTREYKLEDVVGTDDVQFAIKIETDGDISVSSGVDFRVREEYSLGQTQVSSTEKLVPADPATEGGGNQAAINVSNKQRIDAIANKLSVSFTVGIDNPTEIIVGTTDVIPSSSTTVVSDAPQLEDEALGLIEEQTNLVNIGGK